MFPAVASKLVRSGSVITLFFLPYSQKKSCFMFANLQTGEYQPNYKICTCVRVCVPFSLLTFQFILSSKRSRTASYRKAAAALVRIPQQPPETPSHKGMRARTRAHTRTLFHSDSSQEARKKIHTAWSECE